MAILEPGLFIKKVSDAKFDKRTKAGKAAFEEWKQKYPDVEYFLSTEELKGLHHIKETCLNVAEVKNAIQEGFVETSHFVECPDSGIRLKCRPDILNGDIIYDVKTTRDVTPRRFSYIVKDLGYDISAWFYCRVMNLITGIDYTFKIIAVDKYPPYEVVIYTIPPEMMAEVEPRCMDALYLLADCLTSNNYPPQNLYQELIL